VRIVLVVLDHLVVELVFELVGDHAVADTSMPHPQDISESYIRAIFETTRPSSSTCVFQPLKVSSSSSSSCPRRSSRTGCADSGVTRYWYQERSHATVTATSPETPENGTMLAWASPRLLAIPPTVRRYVLALNRSAASRIAISSSDSRRRMGSGGVIVSPFARDRPRTAQSPRRRRRRRRSSEIVGCVGVPSLIQPC